jgi:PadR family transcriptional regulator, regulatory protein PadR
MPRKRKPSEQALSLLRVLFNRPVDWRHGYDLSNETGQKSGTLYPVLMRLAEQGLLESEWIASPLKGAPARHAYRLTPKGVAFANDSLNQANQESDDGGFVIA